MCLRIADHLGVCGPAFWNEFGALLKTILAWTDETISITHFGGAVVSGRTHVWQSYNVG